MLQVVTRIEDHNSVYVRVMFHAANAHVWSSGPVESACVRSGRDNTHALRPTPEPGLLVPATVQTADGMEMDGLRGNVGPHRLPQVHLPVVSMESTGVYWKPVYAILEGALEMVVANAQHVKKVPGRKTDVKDAEWLADLLLHGLLRSSFVPPKPIRELRDLTRYRRKLVESQSAERNRLLKLLETANIKLSSVATDVFGVSGRLMLRALVEGKASPQEMAELAKKKLRSKLPQLEEALEGKVEEHRRFLLKLQLDRLEGVEKNLKRLEERIQEKLGLRKWLSNIVRDICLCSSVFWLLHLSSLARVLKMRNAPIRRTARSLQ